MRSVSTIFSILFTLMTLPLSSFPQNGDTSVCRYFERELAALPHTSLKLYEGIIEFSLDREKYPWCSLEFVSNESFMADVEKLPGHYWHLPDDSDLYGEGWRVNDFVVDGPGTSVYEIEKENTLCLIQYRQPTYFEPSGEFVREETITILTECRTTSLHTSSW